MTTLEVVEVRGAPADIGAALGRHARRAIHDEVRQLPEFRRLLGWLGTSRLAELEAAARHLMPAYVVEVEAMAAAADWPFAEAWLWCCKGDLRAAGEPPDQGCTTLFETAGDANRIGHNEDGAPAHATSGFMVQAEPAGAPAFWSFCYPGLICGNSFAVTDTGLVQTLNNVRALDGRPGLPRQLVARAILAAADLDAALALLQDQPRASGYHHGLARAGDARLLGVEAPASGLAVRRVVGRHAHANHLLEPAFAELSQTVTASSAARQTRATERFVDARRPMAEVLLDGAGERPIHCRGRRGEDSWTLATALFEIRPEAVTLHVHQGDTGAVAFDVTVRP